jgi:hypothetical protein
VNFLLIEAAIRLNLPLFPCGQNKQPLTKRGLYDAATDPDIIREVFQNADAVLIGMPTGPASGFVVVDLDIRDSKDGTVWAKANAHQLPKTRTHQTPGGGFHLLFNDASGAIGNSAGKLAPGVDVRGKGGYVIIPPSPGYRVVRDVAIAELPDWLRIACEKPKNGNGEGMRAYVAQLHSSLNRPADVALRRSTRAMDNVISAPQGTRNQVLNKETFIMACLVREGFISEREVAECMILAGQQAGLDTPEVLATVRSAFNAASGRRIAR